MTPAPTKVNSPTGSPFIKACEISNASQAMSDLEDFHSHGESCAMVLGDMVSVASKFKQYYCFRSDLAKAAEKIKGGVEIVSTTINSNRKIIKSIPLVGPAILAMEQTLGKISEQIFDVISKDPEKQENRCSFAEMTELVLESSRETVQLSADTADSVRVVLATLTNWTVINDCCIDDQLDEIAAEVNRFDIAGATDVYEGCHTFNIPDIELALPDLMIMDSIAAIVEDMSEWINDVVGKFMAEANFIKCCDPVVSFFVDVASDVAGLAMCAVTGIQNGLVEETLDVLLPMVETDILKVVNDLGSSINTASGAFESILSNLYEPAIPTFGAGLDLTAECGLTVDFNLPTWVTISLPDFFLFEPITIDADGTFDMDDITGAIVEECQSAVDAFAEPLGCCPAATLGKWLPLYPEGRVPIDESCHYDTDCVPYKGFEMPDDGTSFQTGNCARVDFTRYGLRCTDGETGSYCAADYDCDGECVAHGIGQGSYCSNGEEGDYCGGITSKDCSSGHYCHTPTDKCYDGTIGDPCGIDLHCQSGTCNSLSKVCSTGADGDACFLPRDCSSGNYCKHNKCRDGSNGDPCAIHRNCQSNNCHWWTKVCE